MGETTEKTQAVKPNTAIGIVALVAVAGLIAYGIHECSSSKVKEPDGATANSTTPVEVAKPATIATKSDDVVAQFNEAADRFNAIQKAGRDAMEENRAPTDCRNNYDIAVQLLKSNNESGSDSVFSNDIYLRARLRDNYNELVAAWRELAKLKPLAMARAQAIHDEKMKNDPAFRAQVEAEENQKKHEAEIASTRQRIEAGTPITDDDAKSNPFLATLSALYPSKPQAELPPDQQVHENEDQAQAREEATIKKTLVGVSKVNLLVWRSSVNGLPLVYNQNDKCYAMSAWVGGPVEDRKMDVLLYSIEPKDFGNGLADFDRVAIGRSGACQLDLDFDSSQNGEIGKIYVAVKGSDALLVEVSGEMSGTFQRTYPVAQCEGKSMKLLHLKSISNKEITHDYDLENAAPSVP